MVSGAKVQLKDFKKKFSKWNNKFLSQFEAILFVTDHKLNIKCVQPFEFEFAV